METKPIRRVVKNSDNDFLFPSGNENSVIGYVDEVNGTGAEEVAGYVPTRHELVQLVKYWYDRVLDNTWFYFTCGQTGSSEWRLNEFAQARIDRASAVIGEEAVDVAIKEAREEFRKKVDNPGLWDIFENGTQGQRDAVVEETYRKVWAAGGGRMPQEIRAAGKEVARRLHRGGAPS